MTTLLRSIKHFGDANVKTLTDRYGVDPEQAQRSLIGAVLPSVDKGYVSPGSSDMGDMSWYAPCSMLQTATWGEPGRGAFLGCGRHRQNIYRAQGHECTPPRLWALSAAELILSPDLLVQAQAEFRTCDRAYSLRLSNTGRGRSAAA